jgi:hypothetical protein
MRNRSTTSSSSHNDITGNDDYHHHHSSSSNMMDNEYMRPTSVTSNNIHISGHRHTPLGVTVSFHSGEQYTNPVQAVSTTNTNGKHNVHRPVTLSGVELNTTPSSATTAVSSKSNNPYVLYCL